MDPWTKDEGTGYMDDPLWQRRVYLASLGSRPQTKSKSRPKGEQKRARRQNRRKR